MASNNTTQKIKIMKLTLVLVGLLLVLHSQVTNAKNKLPKFKHYATKNDGSLSFLVVGDWGRKRTFNQTLVATQMGKVGKALEVDFIISTGDNFYDDGLIGINDPNFTDSFSSIYTSPSSHKPWYAVLGNHDYRGDVLAQLSRDLRRKDRRWHCLRSYIVNADIVDFFFVDTTPFHETYFSDKNHTYDWRGVLPAQGYRSNLLKEVDEALKKSNAKWKFVIGHRTILSAGSHGSTEEHVAQLLPILKVH